MRALPSAPSTPKFNQRCRTRHRRLSQRERQRRAESTVFWRMRLPVNSRLTEHQYEKQCSRRPCEFCETLFICCSCHLFFLAALLAASRVALFWATVVFPGNTTAAPPAFSIFSRADLLKR